MNSSAASVRAAGDPAASARPRLPVTLLTGFLGSGKTTLLNRWLADPAMADTAVIVNEIGEVGIDHLLVDTLDGETLLLESGCVCCSVRDDLGEVLARLIDASAAIPHIGRVVLETTGIADPAAVIQALTRDADVYSHFCGGGVLTVVDATHGERQLDRHVEAVRQVVMADRLLVSKLDLASPAQLDSLAPRLRSLNPQAAVSPAAQSISADLLDTEREFADYDIGNLASAASDQRSYDHRFATFSLGWREPVDWSDFTDWLDGLLAARGDSIHRLKGLVNVRGESLPIVVHGVQHSLYAPTRLARWPDGGAQTRLVFVTEDFPRAAALASLQPFFGDVCT